MYAGAFVYVCTHAHVNECKCMPLILFNLSGVTFHSFIHSEYFYSASSSPLLLRDAPNTAWILCWSFTAKRHQVTASEELARGPYMATRAGFEFVTLQTKGTESINEPPCPINSKPPILSKNFFLKCS